MTEHVVVRPAGGGFPRASEFTTPSGAPYDLRLSRSQSSLLDQCPDLHRYIRSACSGRIVSARPIDDACATQTSSGIKIVKKRG